MLLKRLKKDEKGVVTIEASIILVIFISAYIALLSFFGIYKAYIIVQNALNQSAKEIAQYSYIVKVMRLEDTGKETKKRAEAFKDDSKKTVDTVGIFINATDKGIKDAINSGKELAADVDEAGRELAEDATNLSKNIEKDKDKLQKRLEEERDLELKDIEEAVQELNDRLKEAEDLKGKFNSSVEKIDKKVEDSLDKINKNSEEIDKAYKNMETKITNYHNKYFKDPKGLIREFINLGKDAAYDGVKAAIAYPITKGLMNKYLSIYSNEDFINLGIVNGKDGINYWGSTLFIRGYDIGLVANYRYRIDLPFLNKFELDMRNTAVTRAWVGEKEDKKEEE